MSFFNCTSRFLVHGFVVFFIVFIAHGHGFVSVKWLNGQESFVAEGEVLDACKVSAIDFPSEDLNEHVILESSTNQPHTTDYDDNLFLFGHPVDRIITTYCKVNITVPPEQDIIVTILDADNNDVPSYLYAEKDCFDSSCFDR